MQSTTHAIDEYIHWNPALIRKYDVAGPRYTSYPTAVQFSDEFDPDGYERYLRERPPVIGPLSIYVHIPYCRNICYYCACNKIITRDTEVASRYIRGVEKELDLLARHFDPRRRVTQLHWGGGTPTYLSPAELTQLMHVLAKHFLLIDSPEREYSIELDPRSIDVSTIALLKGLGFNRLSMGIQDFDPAVQRAVNRIQPFEMVAELVAAVREHRFKSLSFDLIYGLPLQGPDSIERTLDKVITLSPDRVSCYSYAHLPEVFSSQRSIDRMQIPSADEKLEILRRIIETLTDAGYLYVGMDHFVKPDDELAQALHGGTLQRNFQGYSTQLAPELLGVGVSAISSTADLYSQNVKNVDRYYALLQEDRLPVQRGLRLSAEDGLRRDVIMQLICRMNLDTEATGARHGIDFDRHFAREMRIIADMEREGLLSREGNRYQVTPSGRPLIRNICMVFDAYLDPARQRFSRTI